ncbi:MAG: hypothetical protein MMC33_005677 [Icmadophila ericetorum]|nr:hypothetical protein [Icmadophila ericetorum]
MPLEMSSQPSTDLEAYASPSSRPASQIMGPPPPPLTSALSSTFTAPLSSSSAATMTSISAVNNTGVGSGPGPMRHPRPLTATDLHLQLEKEQEAVQTASVASTTSSTSTSITDHADYIGAGQMPSQRNRSSSNLSTQSATNHGVSNPNTGLVGGGNTHPLAGAEGMGAARDGRTVRNSMSRQDSSASSRQSDASSPLLSASFEHSMSMARRQSLTHGPFGAHVPPASLARSRSPTRSSILISPRYEEVAYYRSELEAAKRENDALRRRIQELERSLSKE